MNIVADLHTHTSVSHHALSSLEEMIEGARRAGHIAMAVTNHGPAVTDGAHDWHFGSIGVMGCRKINGIYIIPGVELNIMPGGLIDPITPSNLKRLKFCIASFHEEAFEPSTVSAHTEALENILKNPYVNMLGHMGNENFKFDYERIISQCNKNGKIVELNNNSFFVRRGSKENCRVIAELCKKYGVSVAVNSDSHISYTVGEISTVAQMMSEIEFPEELIINRNNKSLQQYFLKTGNIDILEEN